MKTKSVLTSLVLAFSLVQTIAQANVHPTVESFIFTPNDVELIAANILL